MKQQFSLIIIAIILLCVSFPAAAQPLPENPWYVVTYQPGTDTLHWINAQGEQASMARPALADEAEYRDLRISPDGRTMVMVSLLNNEREALGVYSFTAGDYLQTHQAQPGEQINLGGENIFTANSQYFAAGLFSGDFANPAWRIILFETQTGDATAFIDHTHPDAPEVQLSAPAVQYLDGAYVHFQLIPQSVGGAATWPAFAWRIVGFDPNEPLITESPYIHAGIQIQPLTGKVVVPYTDENFAIAPQNGPAPNSNALGSSVLANEQPFTTIHADGTRSHLSARWAKGGEWVLFYSTDLQENAYWNAVLADGTPGNNSHMPFDPQFKQVYGTSDGYLLVNDADALFYTNGFSPNTAQNIAQLTADTQIVYVTPIGVNFMLAQVPDGNGAPVISVSPTPNAVIVTPEPTTEVVLDCSLSPAQRVNIGANARVIPSMGGLNLRSNPNGGIIATLSGGDTFSVIGGAICENGLYWWQIDHSGTVGWLAEGSAEGYFIEPYDGPPPVVVTGCEQALSSRLTVGALATVVEDFTRAHNGPDGEIIQQRFLMSGTTVAVQAGPECSGGQYWWLVSGEAKIRRIGQKTEIIQAWVKETAPGQYRLAP